jgi:uncharacterized phage-like protein YoqJ
MEREITCCFTGHRPNHLPWGSDETDLRCVQLKERLALEIELAYHQGYRRFICGMARGVDLMAGELVVKSRNINSGIILEAAIPCKDQTHGWPDADRHRYEVLLAQCDIVPDFLAKRTPQSMLQRNLYMVSRSSRVIAVYDGVSSGGTKNTLLMAQKEQCEIIFIDPEHPTEGKK